VRILGLTLKTQDIFLSALSGILLVLSFPKFNVEILAWVALVPWLWAIRHKKPLEAAFLGFVAGFVFFAGLLYWIYVVMTEYGGLPGPVSIFVLAILCGYLALYFSAFALLGRWVEGRIAFAGILLAPCLWVSLEYLRGFLLSGFPWGFLGYSQFLTLSLIQIAEITGVYGISFLVVLVNALIFRFFASLTDGRRKFVWTEIGVVCLILLLTLFYGQWRLGEVKRIFEKARPLSLALIQGNIRQDLKWEPKFQEDTVKIYQDLTREAKAHHPDLIIWPETSTPFFFQNPSLLQERVLETAREAQSPILLGAPAFERHGSRIDYFNSAFLISPEKKILGRYDKIHLVPFGEYAPFSGVLDFTREIIGAIGDFSSGEVVRNLSLSSGQFGVLICYEAIFPDLTRQFVKQGAQFLVNITNDAWFGRTAAPYQHFAMVTLRAVENRVYIGRSANTGISGVIDPGGRILSSSGLFTREARSDKIYVGGPCTFYTEWGDLFTFACLGFIAFIFLIMFAHRGYRVERSSR
jgi:apolipoprotein N-acyltransferase